MEEQKTNEGKDLKVDGQPDAVQEAKPAAKRTRRAAARTKRSAKKEVKVKVVKSKRKEAVARARIKPGNGSIRLNRMSIEVLMPEKLRRMILEPIYVSEGTRSLAGSSDIELNVHGGGMTARAEAARSAVAKALAEFSGNDVIRREYMRHDRGMLIDDPRRVEPKKFKGPKARARFQTSYR